MKQRIINMLVAVGLLSTLFASAVVPTANAINVFRACGSGDNGGTQVCQARNRDNVNTLAQNVIGVLFFAVGTIAVIMIIVGGLKYVTANGDSSKITSAKNTILYSVVGLIVALSAYAIVRYVINQF